MGWEASAWVRGPLWDRDIKGDGVVGEGAKVSVGEMSGGGGHALKRAGRAANEVTRVRSRSERELQKASASGRRKNHTEIDRWRQRQRRASQRVSNRGQAQKRT